MTFVPDQRRQLLAAVEHDTEGRAYPYEPFEQVDVTRARAWGGRGRVASRDMTIDPDTGFTPTKQTEPWTDLPLAEGWTPAADAEARGRAFHDDAAAHLAAMEDWDLPFGLAITEDEHGVFTWALSASEQSFADAFNAARDLAAAGSKAETYPRKDGDELVLGPATILSRTGRVIEHEGVCFYRYEDVAALGGGDRRVPLKRPELQEFPRDEPLFRSPKRDHVERPVSLVVRRNRPLSESEQERAQRQFWMACLLGAAIGLLVVAVFAAGLLLGPYAIH